MFICDIYFFISFSTLPVTSLFPFLYFMVRDFGIAEKEVDVSYYAGFLGSAYLVGRALTFVFWGIVADRHGRKPIILLSTSAVVVFNTMFGFCTNYWMAISSRLLFGLLSGILGPIKAYACDCELFVEEHQALGLSAIGTERGIDRTPNWTCYRSPNRGDSLDRNIDEENGSTKFYLAVECLERAVAASNNDERETLARDAFSKLSGVSESADLQTVCKRFKDLRFLNASIN